ncbi:hypothetical protein EIP86_002821 [Pleurotus ostreatoroseus]|nr:hypothetical protein EIP86_002821 [Pleurotus ostreatoroseus]
MSFERTIGEPNPPRIEDSPDVLEDVPARTPSSLPPPGALTVHLEMGQWIDSSETTMVCSVSVTSMEGLEGGGTAPVLPPLVAKFSQPGWDWRLRRGFYYYEEAEMYQGVFMARCYGLFRATFDRECELEGPGVSLSLSGPVTVLLMERLGPHFSLSTSPEPLSPEDTKEKLERMLDHLSRLGIEHDQVNSTNLLAVLGPAEGGWPGLPSPIHNETYPWRLVGFGTAYKTNSIPSQINSFYEGCASICF